MKYVRGDFLGPSHGTTKAAVIANKNSNIDPIRAVNIYMRKGMDHTPGSATKASSVTF